MASYHTHYQVAAKILINGCKPDNQYLTVLRETKIMRAGEI